MSSPIGHRYVATRVKHSILTLIIRRVWIIYWVRTHLCGATLGTNDSCAATDVSLGSVLSRRRSLCTYVLPAARVSMITQVCIRVPLPLLRVHDFCGISRGERNSEYRRNIDKCASTFERWGTQRWTSQRPVAVAAAAAAAAAVNVSSKKAGYKNAVCQKCFHNIYVLLVGTFPAAVRFLPRCFGNERMSRALQMSQTHAASCCPRRCDVKSDTEAQMCDAHLYCPLFEIGYQTERSPRWERTTIHGRVESRAFAWRFRTNWLFVYFILVYAIAMRILWRTVDEICALECNIECQLSYILGICIFIWLYFVVINSFWTM